MKNYRSIYCLGILLYLLCTSCHDFFKESSQDEIKPSSVEDLRGVMYKEAYPYQLATGTFLMLLTDEVQCNGLSNDTYATVHQNGTPVFTFGKRIMKKSKGVMLSLIMFLKYLVQRRRRMR